MSEPFNPVVERALRALEEVFGTPRQARRASVKDTAKITILMTTATEPKPPQHKTVRAARVRGEDAVVASAQAETCWHCLGTLVCDCAICAESQEHLKWKAGQ